MVQGSQKRLQHAPWALAALIVAAIAVVYANSLSGPFMLDDADTVVGNTTLYDWTDIARVLAQPRDTPLAGRPLVAFTFALNYARGGVSVQGYHLTNIAIHTLCALLLFGIVRRTLISARLKLRPTNSESVAFATALLWAIHPLNTEAVNYVTQRTESLMALCLLASLYAAIRSVTCKRTLFWQIAAVSACALGMLCKETMVVAPVLIVMYDRVFFFDSVGSALAARWRLYLGLALTWLALLSMMVPGPRSNTVGFGVTTTPWTYLLNQAVMIARYLRLAVWPHGLVVNYGPSMPLRLIAVLPEAVLIVVLIAATCAAFKWAPPIGFLGAWVFITLAPTSSFVPIATEVGAERRMYLPLMAVAALLTIPVVTTIRRRVSGAAATLAVVAIAVALGTATLARNREYASELSLAESVLARWPTDAAHGMVGSALTKLHRDDEAMKELRLAARSVPRSRYNLGVELYNLKRFDEAVPQLETFASENLMDELAPSARRILGDAFSLQHKWPEAANEYRLALSMIPNDADTKRKMVAAMSNQGLALANAGRFDEAVALFRRVVESDPENWGARRNLTAALLDHHDVAGAETEARRAIAVNPLEADSYDLLGRALALQGKYDEAIVQLRKALTLAPDDAGIREDLGKVEGRK